MLTVKISTTIMVWSQPFMQNDLMKNNKFRIHVPDEFPLVCLQEVDGHGGYHCLLKSVVPEGYFCSVSTVD